LRITGQLVDTTTGNHIWAERYEGALDAVFDLQDRITSSVVAVIEPKVRQAEILRAQAKSTENLTAYDLYLRAYALFTDHNYKEESFDRALEMLARAVAIDPHFSSAYGLVVGCHVQRLNRGWGSVADIRAQGLHAAKLAAETGRDDPRALGWAANGIARFGGHIDPSTVRTNGCSFGLDTGDKRGDHITRSEIDRGRGSPQRIAIIDRDQATVLDQIEAARLVEDRRCGPCTAATSGGDVAAVPDRSDVRARIDKDRLCGCGVGPTALGGDSSADHQFGNGGAGANLDGDGICFAGLCGNITADGGAASNGDGLACPADRQTGRGHSLVNSVAMDAALDHQAMSGS